MIDIYDFLEENSKQVNENNWLFIYSGWMNLCNHQMAQVPSDVDDVAYLTYTLIDAGINPLPYLSTIPYHYAFGIEDLGKVVIPPNIKKIGVYAFFSCKDKFEVELPKTLEVIHRYAFAYSDLKEIRFNSDVYVENNAFLKCKKLKDVYLNKNTTFGSGCFSGTEDLTFHYPGTLEEYKRNSKIPQWSLGSNTTLICTDKTITGF